MKHGFDSHDEHYFLRWFRAWAQRTGINPDPDDPKTKYDYRAAYKDKAVPVWDEEIKKYTWPPEYKIQDEPQNINLNITINGMPAADGI